MAKNHFRRAANAAALLVVLASLLLSGCTPNLRANQSSGEVGPNGEKPLQLRISAFADRFDPTSASVNAGRPVNLIFLNESEQVHQIEVVGLVDRFTLHPEERQDYTVIPERKTYHIVCRIHEDAEMEAEFIGE